MQSPDENLKFDECFNVHESALLEKFNELMKKDGIIAAVKFT